MKRADSWYRSNSAMRSAPICVGMTTLSAPACRNLGAWQFAAGDDQQAGIERSRAECDEDIERIVRQYRGKCVRSSQAGGM